MPSNTPLPPTFTSLYRLFLRATASSVLHHAAHTRHLRKLFRPAFQEAAGVIHRIEKGKSDQEHLSRWLDTWQTRVDNTLSLLANSSASRGLPHNLTRNLSALMRLDSSKYVQKYHWDPKLDATSKAYQPRPLESVEKDRAKQAFNDEAFGALGELIMMAEGRHGILLGRVMKKGTVAR